MNRRGAIMLVLAAGIAASVTAGCGVPRTLGGQDNTSNGGPPPTGASHTGGASYVHYGTDVPSPNMTLTLGPMSKPNQMNLKPAPDMPNVKVDVTLPVYPGAAPTTLSYPEAFASYPNSPYLVMGKTKYLAPAAESDVNAWYRSHLASAGYAFEGQGSTGNLKTGEHSDGLTFHLKAAPDVQVIVSLEAHGSSQTLVQYWVNDVLTPPRPASTMLPTDIQRIEVDYRPFGFINGQKVQHFTITDPKVIHNWVTRINALSRDTRGVHSCPADTGQHITLHCYTANGQTHTVNLGSCGGVSVDNGPALADNGVWGAVVSVIDPSHSK